MLTITPAVLLRVCDSSSGSHSTPLAAPSEGSSACVVKCVPLRVLVRCTSVYTSACDAGPGVPGPLPEAQRRGNEGGAERGLRGTRHLRRLHWSTYYSTLHLHPGHYASPSKPASKPAPEDAAVSPITTEKWMSAQMEGSPSRSDPVSFTSYHPGGVTIGMYVFVAIFTFSPALPCPVSDAQSFSISA